MSQYYSLKRILKTNADMYIIFGQRSNGKTYSCINYSLSEYLESGKQFAYLRRYDEEIKRKNISELITAQNLEKMSKGKYNSTSYQSNRFRLIRKIDGQTEHRDDNNCCTTFSLNTWETTKGADNGFFNTIIFDEFLTRRNYLPDEYNCFTNLLSSLMRDRLGSKVFMLGNTVNKYCPYFFELGISDTVQKMSQGDIVTVESPVGLKIAIEYCAESSNTKAVSKFFRQQNKTDMISTGKWELKNYPHLTRDHAVTKDNIVFKCFVILDNRVVCADVCRLDTSLFLNWHWSSVDEIKDNDWVYSFTPSVNPRYACTIADGKYKPQQIFAQLIAENAQYYASNDVGEYVRNWLIAQRQFKRSLLL